MKQVRPSLSAMKMQQTRGQLGTPGGKESVSANSQPLRVACQGGEAGKSLIEGGLSRLTPYITVSFSAGLGGHNPKGAGVSKMNLLTKTQIFMDRFHTYQMLSLTFLNQQKWLYERTSIRMKTYCQPLKCMLPLGTFWSIFDSFKTLLMS